MWMLVLAVLLSCSPAFAASPWTEADSYKGKTIGKLDFGLKNLLGGWMELINRPVKYHQEDKSFTKGAVVGLYNAAVYTIGGALHTGTFFLPVDVPLPNNGVSFE